MIDNRGFDRPPTRLSARIGNLILIVGAVNSLLLTGLVLVMFFQSPLLAEGIHHWLREYWAEIMLVYILFEVWQPLVRAVTSIMWVTIDFLASAMVFLAYGSIFIAAIFFEGVILEWRPLFGLALTLIIDLVLLTALAILLSRRLIGGAVGVAG
jgi:hypothetical protein